MEIERKFLVKQVPGNLNSYSYHDLEQAYLCTSPVVRVRQEDDNYYMTYKGAGYIQREEYNLPLDKESYNHLKAKADGNIITKRRYLIPYDKYTIELDIFKGAFEGLIYAEVEFDTLEEANSFTPPSWFGTDVTESPEYTNSYLSKKQL